MNTAILHHKVLGMPVWAVGLGGAAVVVIYRHFHVSGVAGAQADTTAPADVATGDPVPADSGVFPQTIPGYTGGATSSGADVSGVSDALGGLADAILNQAPSPDYTSQFADLNAGLGALRDQQATDHGQDVAAAAAAAAHAKSVAGKAGAAHAKAVGSRGGHATAPVKAKPAAKPTSHHEPTSHPKAPAAKSKAKAKPKGH